MYALWKRIKQKEVPLIYFYLNERGNQSSVIPCERLRQVNRLHCYYSIVSNMYKYPSYMTMEVLVLFFKLSIKYLRMISNWEQMTPFCIGSARGKHFNHWLLLKITCLWSTGYCVVENENMQRPPSHILETHSWGRKGGGKTNRNLFEEELQRQSDYIHHHRAYSPFQTCNPFL